MEIKDYLEKLESNKKEIEYLNYCNECLKRSVTLELKDRTSARWYVPQNLEAYKDIREKGNIIVDARIFGDIFRKLPDGDVEFFTTNESEVMIVCKNTNFNILYLSAQGYPDIKKVEDGDKIKIYSKDLKNIIKNAQNVVGLLKKLLI